MATLRETIRPSAALAAPPQQLIAFAVMVGFLLTAPLFIYPVFLMTVLCFALFACAFNLLIGYAGLLSFGHALFFGWAAYVTGHLAKVGRIAVPYWWAGWDWLVIPLPPLSPELAILGGAAAGAVLGLVAGAIAIRRQGIYFAMITLALAQMMYFFALQAPFTRGEDGIQAIPRERMFGLLDLGHTMTMYFVVLAIFLAGFLLIFRIVHSPFGQVLKAIRENEPRAVSLGYKADQYKLIAFVLSATLSGLAGGTKAVVSQIASLTDVQWTMSGEVVLMTLIGGLAAALSGRARRLGDGDPGRHLRRLRAHLPPRTGGRAGPPPETPALIPRRPSAIVAGRRSRC
jgi:branched-chain amino acid transport system permease protein